MIHDYVQPGRDHHEQRETPRVEGRSQGLFTFVTAGATLGLVLGFVEAGLLRYLPRLTGLVRPDVRGAIWLIAPLADGTAGALAGLFLGLVAVLLPRARPMWRAGCAFSGFGGAAAYLGWLFFWFRVGVGRLVPPWLGGVPLVLNLLLTPILYFIGGFATSMLLLRSLRRRKEAFPPGAWRAPLAILDLAAITVLASSLIVVHAHETQRLPPSRGGAIAAIPHNNVVLIMLDTVRADHLSCYGYARPTTPHLDALAHQGVLFEQAVAPTSWTLPSLATVLTGLLPHQHGATWTEAMATQPLTLAEILKAQGYQTAAFNANQQYGLAGWGLDQGFDTYVDGHNWLRHNLAATFVGQSLYQMLFREFIGFNEFDHMDAGQINERVLDWYARRARRPYFLFINYMDAHRPYLPPSPYRHRFGRIPKRVLWHISSALHDGHWRHPILPSERQDMIDGYDNSLHYLDGQIAHLLDVLRASPDGSRTFVIVAGDHGEGFGEHGTYDHGWNLYRDVLHVPLLVSGPDIPAGERVTAVTEVRELFPTVIELALGKAGAPVRPASLSRYWMPGSTPEASSVVSELMPSPADRQARSALSLFAAHWHFLVDSQGHTELFDWQKDAAESRNLAASPEMQRVVEQLQAQMESILAHSVSPWWQVAYFSPLDQPGRPFVKRALSNPKAFPLIGQPVGSCQAFFQAHIPPSAVRPTPSQEELLRSLPYH